MKDLKPVEVLEVSGGNRPTPDEISPYEGVQITDPLPSLPPSDPSI